MATLVEPLLSTNQRIKQEIDFRDVARHDARWFATYTGGLLAGVAMSLPYVDPWRTVEIDKEGVAKWPDGRLFGTPNDAADILRSIPELEDTGVDPTTLALEEGLAPDAAALIAIAFNGWQPTSDALLDTHHRGDGDAMFDRATHSIRWTEHRRRAYRPEAFDVWLDHLSLEWTGWADNICNGESVEWIDEEIEVGASRERDALAAIARDLEFFS